MPTILIVLAAFMGVAALVGGVAMLLGGKSKSSAEKRLDFYTKGGSEAGRRKAEQSVLAHPLDDMPSAIEEFLMRFFNLRRLLEQADLSVSVQQFVMISALAGAAGAVICLVTPLPAATAPVAALMLAATPIGYVIFKRKRRLAAFGRQLPAALELIARALRAGHSLGSGFHLVASEASDPIAKEMNRVYEQQNLGIALEDALEDMTRRVPNLDLRFFATAVILQRQTGGDLAEILDKIGTLIRERFKIYGQIQALTGEGRLSGVVLLALPPVLFAVMYRLNHDYIMMLFTDPLGKKMLAFGVLTQILGALVIRKIINIKV